MKGWFPRAYFGDKDLILMEDLTKRGFTGPSPPNHNFNTAKSVQLQLDLFPFSSALMSSNFQFQISLFVCILRLVVEQLGKFHASSYGWLQSLKQPANNIFPELYDILEQADMSEIFSVLLDASNNISL